MGVRASTYYDAHRRHITAWFEGEDVDIDSGLPHLCHAIACLAIIIDAGAAGKLNDDRQYPGGYRGYIDSMTPHVTRLKKLRGERGVLHFTIQEAKKEELPGAKYPWDRESHIGMTMPFLNELERCDCEKHEGDE
jgi:hypothetical protein